MLRSIRVVVLSAAALALVGTAVAAAAGSLPEGARKMAPAPAPTPPPLPVAPQPPLFRPTGGPYIGEQTALQTAAQIAESPVGKQDVRFMRYRDVVAYTGNRTLTIDLDREVYFVVTTGTFVGRHGDRGDVVCPAYITVLDATTGVGLSVICVSTSWPLKLPVAFR
jgi:hypothetical protein